MREPAGRIKPESGARRCRDSTIDEVDGFGERTGPVEEQTDAPRRTLGPRSDRPYLAHIDQRRRKTRFAQPVCSF